MSTTKLDWNYDQSHDCEVAFHNGYMIKAERDDSPNNPFEDWDCNWPIHVYAGRDGSWSYPKDEDLLRGALRALTDAQLLHDQIAIAQALDTSITEITVDTEAGSVRYCRDADHLREMFTEYRDCLPESKQLEAAAAIWQLAGVPAYVGTTTGYSQGDWAEVLVVATPEKREEFGCKDVTEKDLEGTADLYGYWAWGDVYGYTLWAPEFDEDGEVEDWAQLDDSCWGFYGDDHDKSGLEEGALSALPDEPVRVPDKIEEIAA